MRKIRTVAVFPTLFTLGNLVCGFFAIVVASRVDALKTVSIVEATDSRPARMQVGVRPSESDRQNVSLSGWLIFLAMVFDALDGHIARLSRTSSEFGAELDSLCDVVSFGVAPGFLLVAMCPQFTYMHSDAMWVIAATLPVCAALRLARFNVETSDDDDHLRFSGLPSPAAAGSIAGFAILFFTLNRDLASLEGVPARPKYMESIDWSMQHLLPFFALAVALLMVSRVPYPHIVNQLFRGHRGFSHVVGLLFAAVAIVTFRSYALPILVVLFVLGPPLHYTWLRLKNRTPRNEPLFD